MRRFLEVRTNGASSTLEVVPISCGWVDILCFTGNGNGARIHSCPDLGAARLYLTYQMGGEITREWTAQSD